MNFDDAIKAHTDWKIKLSIYLKKPDGSIKAADICHDNKCALGHWIYGDGLKHAALPEYQTLKNEHSKFHRAAAEVVRKADSGASITENMAIGSNSEFDTRSKAVVHAIMTLRKKI